MLKKGKDLPAGEMGLPFLIASDYTYAPSRGSTQGLRRSTCSQQLTLVLHVTSKALQWVRPRIGITHGIFECLCPNKGRCERHEYARVPHGGMVEFGL